MYDPWGVGEALQMSMRMFSHGKRATGRSTLLLNSVQNNDTVVFAQRMEAQRMERLFTEQGKTGIKLIVHDPSHGVGSALSTIERQYDRRGVLHFDHSWFEAVYLYEVRDIMNALHHFNDDMAAQQKRKAEETFPPAHLVDTVRAMGGGDIDADDM